jgi:hypothetical protein
VLIFVAAAIMLIATHPRFMLVAMAYSYLASAFVGMAITRFRHRGRLPAAGPESEPAAEHRDSAAR